MTPSPVPKPAPFKLPQVFAEALALHSQGRLAEAESLYSQVLVHRPDHFGHFAMLSVIKLAKGHALQLTYGEMIGRIVARRFLPAPLPPPPAPGESIRIGIVSSFFIGIRTGRSRSKAGSVRSIASAFT